MPVGGHGSIAFQTLGRRKVRARCWVRDVDGVRRRVETIGTSRENAREKLLAALQLRPGFRRAGLAGTSTIAEAIDVWLAELDRRAADGEIAISTPTTYRSVVNVHVRPGLGALRLQEVDAPTLDAFLVGMRARHGFAVTKTARSALNGVFGLAIRQHAIRANPMRDIGRITSGRRAKARRARALTQAERDDWIAKMEADELAVARDLPDLTRWMLATGCRIGESLAVTFDEIDLDAKTVVIEWTIVRVSGRGLLRVPTKSAAGERTLSLPGWAVDMVMRRGEALGWAGPLFPIPKQRQGGQRWSGGVWRDPSNTMRDLRRARERAGYEWVTSHVFRKTVATVMLEAGFTAREIADQLGHSKMSLTQDVYVGREAVSHGAVALADMWGTATSPPTSFRDPVA